MIQSTRYTAERIVKEFMPKTYKPCELPTATRPFALFDNNKIDCFVRNKEMAIPRLASLISNAKTEAEKTECIFIADQMAENGTKNMGALYRRMSKFNNDKSPNVQTFLSGFYRKTLNPDAFGPLVKTMMDNVKTPHKNISYDPNEEVGGAVIEYLRDAFQKQFKNNKKVN